MGLAYNYYCSDLFLLLILEREEVERERERYIDLLFHLFSVHWLILVFLVCALTRVWAHHLGVSGQHSNQLSYLHRAVSYSSNIYKLGFFYKSCPFSLTHLFNYLFTIYEFMDIYFVLQVIIPYHYYLFWCSDCSRFCFHHLLI